MLNCSVQVCGIYTPAARPIPFVATTSRRQKPRLYYRPFQALSLDSSSVLERQRVRMSSFDVLMAEAIVALVVSPLVGVAVAVSRRLLAGVLVAIALSILAHWTAAGASIDSLRPILLVHTTLGAAAIALVAVGAFYRTAFGHVLDAAACALGTAVTVGFGIFVIGPAAIALPAALLDVALVANPLVATAAAADVDLFRGDLLYHLSPIAHRQFDYPAWQSAAGLYFVIAAAAWYGAARANAAAAEPPLHQPH